MIETLRTISSNKRICTGSELTYKDAPQLNPTVTTEDAFGTLVAQYSTFFREEIATDVAFLCSVERRPRAIAQFENAVYQLRTARFHKDNQEANAFYQQWTANHRDWQSAGEALAEMLQQALSHLARISSKVRLDPRLATAWRDRVSIQAATVFDAVCADLAVSFGERQRAVMVRSIEQRLKRLVRPGVDIRAVVEASCVEEIVNQSKELPVAYHEVLDRLGLIGHPMARGAILLAYSIDAVSGLHGEAFLIRVEEAWKVSTA